MQIKGIGAVGARDLEHVAETCGGHERRARAAALDQRIDDQCGAVIDQRCFRRLDAGLLEAVENAVDQIVIGRGAFCVENFLRGVVERDQIRKSAANVDGDGVGHSWFKG